MTDVDTMTDTPNEISFTIIVEGQAMHVRYQPDYFASIGYAHFEFSSPHEPRRRIPLSETGYRSHFVLREEVEAAPDEGTYAQALALALMRHAPVEDDDAEPELALF